MIIQLDTRRYKAPSTADIEAAKRYVLRREKEAVLLADEVQALLLRAAEQVVRACYKYDTDPRMLSFSDNPRLDKEIDAILDTMEEKIYLLITEHATTQSKDRNRRDMLLVWFLTLGRRKRGVRDTLHTYVLKTKKDWEAAAAALRWTGLTLPEAITRIKTYLNNIYAMPEIRIAIRSGGFAAEQIRNKGTVKGARGISNNGATNIINTSKITLQMAWMRSLVMDYAEEGAVGIYVLRGSDYDCPLCDSIVGFHPTEDASSVLPVHPNCMCYAVPVYLSDTEV